MVDPVIHSSIHPPGTTLPPTHPSIHPPTRNYLSVGLDAQAAYDFHSLRNKRPWLTAGRMSNQAWYSFFSCNTGEEGWERTRYGHSRCHVAEKMKWHRFATPQAGSAAPSPSAAARG